MDRERFYNQENIEADDLNDLQDNIESLMIEHLQDFHASESQDKVKSGLNINATSPEGLQIQITQGSAYGNYRRIELPTNQLIGPLTVPTAGADPFAIRRIDIVYIIYDRLYASPEVRRFVDINGNIIERTIYTELQDYYSLVYLAGTESDTPTPPILPTGAVELAKIYLRKDTVAIFSSDTGLVNEGYFVDTAAR